jgi:hypothetical protein
MRGEKAMLYRIGNSKEPTLTQMERMVYNLRTKHKDTFFISHFAKAYSHTSKIVHQYQISAISETDCKIYYQDSWPKCIADYRKIMKEGVEYGS